MVWVRFWLIKVLDKANIKNNKRNFLTALIQTKLSIVYKKKAVKIHRFFLDKF